MDVQVALVKNQSKCYNPQMIPNKPQIKKVLMTWFNGTVLSWRHLELMIVRGFVQMLSWEGFRASELPANVYIDFFSPCLAFILVNRPFCRAFLFKELHKYSTEGFTLPVGKMQPLLVWKVQPFHIRWSEEITIPPLQDENTGSIKGEALIWTEFRQKFPSGAFGNVTRYISWPYIHRTSGFLHLAWKTSLQHLADPGLVQWWTTSLWYAVHWNQKGTSGWLTWVFYVVSSKSEWLVTTTLGGVCVCDEPPCAKKSLSCFGTGGFVHLSVTIQCLESKQKAVTDLISLT